MATGIGIDCKMVGMKLVFPDGDTFDYETQTWDYSDAALPPTSSMTMKLKNAEWNGDEITVYKDNHSLMCGDTSLPGYLSDTGYSRGISGGSDFARDVKHLEVLLGKPKAQRCSYCNLKALPEDRFCEGCGAPV